MVIDDRVTHDETHLIQVLDERFSVLAGNEVWIGKNRRATFEVHETRWAIEFKIELSLFEKMEDCDVVLPKT